MMRLPLASPGLGVLRFRCTAGVAYSYRCMLKIIGGEHRSRILLSPDDDRTSRPYTARVRESVFNLLRGWFDDARVLDLFAGVGTMGLEAVSRGAAQVVMVERDREVYDLLQRNIAALHCEDRATAIHADALSPVVLARAPKPVDVAFVDPPYPLMTDDRLRAKVLEQVARLRDVLADRSFVVLRSPLSSREADLTLEGFDGPEAHDYGHEMHVLLYAPRSAVSE